MSSKPSTNRVCSLGIHETCNQKSIQLQHYPSCSSKNESLKSTSITTTPWHLEQLMDKYLQHPEEIDDNNVEEEEEYSNPVKLFLSEDAHLLKSRHRLNKLNINSVFGIWENTSLFVSKEQYNTMSLKQQQQQRNEEVEEEDDDDIHVNIHLNIYKAAPNVMNEKNNTTNTFPKGDWSRRNHDRHNQTKNNDINSNGCTTKSNIHHHDVKNDNVQTANLTIIDLTPIQQQRRRHQQSPRPPQDQQQKQQRKEILTWNTPGRVCQLLRSILIGDHDSSYLHCASPWSHAYNTNQNDNQHDNDNDIVDSVIGILVYRGDTNNDNNGDENNNSFCSELEREEYDEIIKFRTGDAVPSYFLYSCSHIEVPVAKKDNDNNNNNNNENDECDVFLNDLVQIGKEESETEDDETNIEKRAAALLIYRLIPPRDHLSPYPPPPPPQTEAETAVETKNDDKNIIRNGRKVTTTADGCLWETYYAPSSTVEGEVEKQHRKVAPPYINVDEEYPGLMDHFLTPENFQAMKEEALRIPQWTAWPERQHYRTTSEESDGEEEEDSKNGTTSAYPASWTVFPLCHTFPAYNLSNRKFISSTCSFAPQTTQLLLSLGSKLRTALFSRLDPQTVLSAHTGWEDLANHVLRVHIPLIVPKDDDDDNKGEGRRIGGGDGGTNLGLCGTWVDGCVETHEEGRLICFDDSKTHRAFNYAKEERIVLIVDLERNVSCPDENGKEEGSVVNYSLPIGTATGGHTEELDNFINQLT